MVKLSKLATDGLLKLLSDEQESGWTAIFPGAIGRAGISLVRFGLAKNLGRFIYSGNRPSMGERPDAYVRFELTPKGRQLAKTLTTRKHS